MYCKKHMLKVSKIFRIRIDEIKVALIIWNQIVKSDKFNVLIMTYHYNYDYEVSGGKDRIKIEVSILSIFSLL